ncbi:MAG: hypothetical protein Q8909_06155 [Bacteroidota bacterium]|nr:hypothetical protein [Bacteroidota bacterium]
MKKLLLLFVLMATAMFSIAQNPKVNHFRNLFSSAGKQSTRTLLKSATSPLLQLDSCVIALDEKLIFSYNDNCISYIGHKWNKNTSVWELGYKGQYFYDNNGNDTLAIFYNWDSDLSSWSSSYMDKCYYSQDKKDSLSISFYMNNSSWKESESTKYEHYPDANGLDTMVIEYYKYRDSPWEINSKMVYKYDNLGNCLSWTDYWHSDYNDKWLLDFKFEYAYDYSCNSSDIQMLKPRFHIQNKITTESTYNYNSLNSTWEFAQDRIFYYSSRKDALGINTLNYNTLKARYRNGQMTISGINPECPVIISNIQGPPVYHQQVSSSSVSINVPDNGMYIVRNGAHSIKVVKQ